MTKSKKRKSIEYGGKTYVGEVKYGSLHVRVKKTANGQMLLAGIYDLQDKNWQDNNKKNIVPSCVKRQFEVAFI